ncbi:MAG TPA: helix-turn-helix domain-containing protein [Telluria sp.]|nr:helix-turn-helix domain-containing protein [Telluria sp.]
MDSIITAAARALAAGDPLSALNFVALRDDAPALAMRGIAMAQLGDLTRARTLVRKAARAFGTSEPVARGRCLLAEAEIALAARDLDACLTALGAARQALDAHGDHVNAAHARYLEVRRLLLIGRLDEAERALMLLDPASLSAALRTAHELTAAGIAMRRLRAGAARVLLARAAAHARLSGIRALMEEVRQASRMLDAPAARLIVHGGERTVLLDEVEALMASPTIVVDSCRYLVKHGDAEINLARRPILFTLARTLAQAWPGDISREALIAQAFRIRHVDDTHRARLRVEMSRLRAVLRPMAGVSATAGGFMLVPGAAQDVAVLAHPAGDAHAPVLALLADGEAWSSSALAQALGASQRTVQRALDVLAAAGMVQAFGRGRARRWSMPPMPGFATSLLLPTALAGG